MILQMVKFLKKDLEENKAVVLRKDFYGDVVSTRKGEKETFIHFSDGTIKAIYFDQTDDFDEYIFKEAWLLNDEGKTIHRIF